MSGVILGNSQQRDAQARELLETVASQVQPILRRRKWTVPMLSEFYPQQRNLLVSCIPRTTATSLLPCPSLTLIYGWLWMCSSTSE